MRLETSDINPLSTILNLIPDQGLELTREHITNIGNIIKTGGVVAESYKEVVDMLFLIETWYNLWNIKFIDKSYKLFKVNNGNQITE